MKYLARIFLFLFIAFLSAPTIISLIARNDGVSSSFNFNEEEIYKDFNEIKANLKHDYEFTFIDFPKQTIAIIISANLSKHDNVSEEIFYPPPEFI